jgi:hypothetical protein
MVLSKFVSVLGHSTTIQCRESEVITMKQTKKNPFKLNFQYKSTIPNIKIDVFHRSFLSINSVTKELEKIAKQKKKHCSQGQTK